MKKKTKKMCKVISVFLVFLIVAQILPLQVLAENITNAIAHKEFIENSLIPAPADGSSDATILYEVKEKRDEHTKVYKKSDGTYTAVKTVEPLHYLDNGVWEEINNSMTLNGNLYTNLDNLFNVEFPESIDSNENLTVEKDGYELSFSVDEIEESSAVVENDIVVSETNIAVADEAISQTQSSVTYNDIAENTDLQYIVTPNSIKENIIVSDKESVKDTYTFTFETNGLDAEKLDDGSVVFKDDNDEIKFRIPRPVMTDSNLAFSYDINVDLIENENETVTLEYSPSSDWTNNCDRVYPITIDPAITVGKYEPWVEDTYVAYNSDTPNVANQNNADAYLTTLTNMLTQENSDGTTTTMDSEIYTRINTDFFKNLGNDIVFTEVQYIVAGITTANGKIFAKEISQNWNVDTVTYNIKPELSSEVIDYYTSPLNEGEEFDNFAYVHFNITKIFNEWFNGKTNNGFALTAVDETVAFIIINGGSQNTSMVLDYVDMGGYNETLNYHSQSVGKAGTGYVNDFTQHLSVIRDDLSIDGNIMPVTVGMVYDSARYSSIEYSDDDNMLVYGTNWIPNYLRAYIFSDDEHVTYYTDTGATIEFVRSIDDEGNVTFTELNSETYGNHGYAIEYHPASNDNNEYYTVTRPDEYVEKFNTDGFLTSVTNYVYTQQPSTEENGTPINTCNEQTINVVYDTDNRIDYVTDGVGRKYDYIYNNTTDLLSKIKCYATDGTPINAGTTNTPLEVNYTYDSNNNLIAVIFPGGKSATYTYDANGNMTSMTNIDGYRVVYNYDANGRVKNITEQALNNSYYINGNHLTYNRLSPTQIKLTDGSNNYEIYQFNNKGKLLYTIDNSGNFSINENVGSNNNTYFLLSDDYRASSENLLLNSNFEQDDDYWVGGNLTSITADDSDSNNHVCVAKTNELTQTINVLSGGGKYTFSAYVKSGNTGNDKLMLNISAFDISGILLKTESTPVESTNGKWERYSVTIDTPTETKSITVGLISTESSDIFHIDNVQLEHSPAANAYNYIENGSFKYGFDSWEEEPTYQIIDTEINGSFERAVLFDGDTDGENTFYQTVKINGKKGDAFTVGGWLKSYFVNSSTQNTFLLKIMEESDDPMICNFTDDRYAQIQISYEYKITKEDNTTETLSETIVVPFTENINDWQFASNDFILRGDCEEVMIAVHYFKHANPALVSKLELTKNNGTLSIAASESDSDDETYCNCPNCEEVNCPCTCINETLCTCAQCMRRKSTIEKDKFGNITSQSSFDGIKTIQTFARFSGNGNYILAETDANGNTIGYEYDESNGLLKAIEYALGNVTSYDYNAENNITQMSSGYIYDDSNTLIPGDSGVNSVVYTYTNDKITTIDYNGFSYNLSYDCWGQLVLVSIGTQPVISYEYDGGKFRDRIKTTLYYNSNSNPTKTDYIYDDFGNITKILVNGTKKFEFRYDSMGTLIEISEVGYRTVRYTDSRTEILDAEGNYIYTTDTNENGELVEKVGDTEYITKSYGVSVTESSRGTDEKDIKISNGKTIGIRTTVDLFGRYDRTVIQTESVNDTYNGNKIAAVTSKYIYPELDDNSTSNRVVGYENKVTYGKDSTVGLKSVYGYGYEYDANGNITTINNYTLNGTTTIDYEYDNYNQLVSLTDYANNSKYIYHYDDGGNITSKEKYETLTDGTVIEETKEVINYSYYDNWKDRLKSYNGQTIEYDNIGNPTRFNEATLTWTGRQLDTYTIVEEDEYNNHITKQVRYNYDENGLMHRKSVYTKPVDSSDESYQLLEQYDYNWVNGKLINQVHTKTEEDGTTNSNTIKFIYDLMNTPYGFVFNDSTIYLYLRNIQGDITGIVDELGNVVLSYEYDAWGVPSEPSIIDDETVAYLKTALPLTYRGHYYDYDTSLYYIQNRYYNPETGRFINADSTDNLGLTGTVLGYNLFTYCENNPITYVGQNANTQYLNTINDNYLHNKKISQNITGYIYDQSAGVAAKLRLGIKSSAYVGCGWVATYNAMIMLGNRLEPCDIIREYEINGVFLYGTFGVHQTAVARFFINRGYDVTVSFNVEKYDEIAQRNDANVMFVSHSNGGHFSAFKWNGTHYSGYNTFAGRTESIDIETTLENYVTSRRAQSILISISNKKQSV